ncbi:MAG: alpha-D-ribose 1-methylphosphonate 5-triphosphate diphosphatase [Rhodospirillales bacterium]|nr:alpha-D-ribose 1-methylphosphonate 5-triphosphate diphosphatase [Rhodospirillales bacterium]MDE2574770.1 alpha-D-ribose 1-methylphosphonate 5-triphosphate diphosphatase [Rhodospirillales bacterium]
MQSLHITGGQVLAEGALHATDLVIEGDAIAGLGTGTARHRLDAADLLVLPGIVDIHGDAFERQMQPRPGVDFPTELALADTESQLLANGITTAFHGVTLSWEPGLRSHAAWRRLLAALAAGRFLCDMRVHLRWEAFNLAALDEALADIAAGRVHLLAFNDHTPAILKKIADPVSGAKYAERAGMDLAAFRRLAEQVAAREAEVAPARLRLADAARAAGLPMASHDDDTVATRRHFRDLGALVCEFPMAEAVGQAARAAGDAVVMGSPNVVRGGSHLGWASAATLAEAGICSVLSSDYFYPCLLRAPFILAGRGALGLAESWALVSANPAAAAGLHDRGAIATGRRADLLLVDAGGAAPRLVATIAGGRLAWAGADAAERLSSPARSGRSGPRRRL